MENPLNGKLVCIDKLRDEKYKTIYDLAKSLPKNAFKFSSDDELCSSNLIILRKIEETYKISYLDYVDDDTVKILEYCSSYYKYIGIRTILPEHYKKYKNRSLYDDRYQSVSNTYSSIYGQPYVNDDTYQSNPDKYKKVSKQRRGEKDGWPAIWSACNSVGINSCGNSHQYQINDKLSTGLYVKIKGNWCKVIKKIIWNKI